MITYQRIYSKEICVHCVRSSNPGTIFIQNVRYTKEAKARNKSCRECKRRIIREKAETAEVAEILRKLPKEGRGKRSKVRTVEIVSTEMKEEKETEPCEKKSRSMEKRIAKNNNLQATIIKEIPEPTNTEPMKFTRSILKSIEPEEVKLPTSKPLPKTIEIYTFSESDTETEGKNKLKRKHSTMQEISDSETTYAKKKIIQAMKEYMPPVADDAPILETTLTNEEMAQEIKDAMTEETSLEFLESAISGIEMIPLTSETEEQLWKEIDELLHSI